MGRYFQGLIQQTDLKFRPGSSSFKLGLKQGTRSVAPLESDQRVIVEQPPAARSEQPTPLAAASPKLNRRLHAGEEIDAQASLPAEEHHGSEEPSRHPLTPESASAVPYIEMESWQQAPEMQSGDVLHSIDLVDEDLPVEKVKVEQAHVPEAELHVVEEIRQLDEGQASPPPVKSSESPATAAAEPHEFPGDEAYAQPEYIVETQNQPESSGQKIVRQVLEWIGEEKPQQENAAEDAASAQVIQNLHESKRVFEHRESLVVEPSVVEQEQSLHLSIGSIVMTLEGQPGDVSAVPERQQRSRQFPQPTAEPPIRLSRHYLRLR